MEEQLSASFDAATRFVESNSSRFSDKVLLQLYGYYKQATHGPCTLQQKRPGMFDFKGRAKYDAWARLGADVTISQAQRMYVNLLTESIPDWEQEKAKQAHGPVFSMPMATEEETMGEEFPLVIQHVQEGDLESLTKLVENCPHVVADRDAEGCTPLHWAADKGNIAMVRLLLNHGADVHAVDIDGQRPLEYALAMPRTDDEEAYLESALA